MDALLSLDPTEKDALIRFKSKTGITPLGWASAYGQRDVVVRLADLGTPASLRVEDKQGATCLHLAATGPSKPGDSIAVAQELLRREPELLTWLDDSLQTPEKAAEAAGHYEFAAFLKVQGGHVVSAKRKRVEGEEEGSPVRREEEEEEVSRPRRGKRARVDEKK